MSTGKLEKIRDVGFKNFLKTDVLNIVWVRVFVPSTPAADQAHVPWSILIKIVHRLIQEFRRRNMQFLDPTPQTSNIFDTFTNFQLPK